MNDVEWDGAALDMLADIWVQATVAERDEIGAAVLPINLLLRRDPLGQGESRDGYRRLMFEWPLWVIYWHVPASGVVPVTDVSWVRRRRNPPAP